MNAPSVELPKKRKPRMHHIASAARVSIGTVSRALNGKPDVSPELVERVTRAAQAMGYDIRNSDRQTPKQARGIGNIGYIVDAVADAAVAPEPFQQHFLSGVEQTVMSRGGHLLISSCRNEILKNTIPPMIVEKLVGGVILKANNETPESWIERIGSLLPVVLLMHRNLDLRMSSVMCDNRGAVYQLLRHLKELGHERVGFFFENEIPPKKNSLHHDERLEAFMGFSASLGLRISEGYIQAPSRDAGGSEDLAHVADKAMHAFLGLATPPTAVICAADIYALALIRSAQSAGLTIPRDISIAGIMSTEVCDYSNPTITSVSLSEIEIGRAAVDLLGERMDRPSAMAREMVVGSSLVARQSTSSPRRRRENQ